MWNFHWRREGKDPDYRFSLANERTFLAWIRTALALLAGGVALEQFASKLASPGVLAILATSLALLSAILCAAAYWRWRGNEIAMRHNIGLPFNLTIPLLATGTLAASGMIAVLLVIR
jgi:putative membrane protein